MCQNYWSQVCEMGLNPDTMAFISNCLHTILNLNFTRTHTKRESGNTLLSNANPYLPPYFR